MRWRGALGFWCCGGWDFFDADGVGPLGDEGVSCFHRHPCILHEHLRAFEKIKGVWNRLGQASSCVSRCGLRRRTFSLERR